MSQKNRRLPRRLFLQGSAIALLGAPSWGIPSDKTYSRVVVVRDENAIDVKHNVRPDVVRVMLQRGLLALTQDGAIERAWRRVVSPNQRVAVKSNLSGLCAPTECHEAISQNLTSLGIKPDNIRFWDRCHGGIGPERIDPLQWDWSIGYDENDVSNAVRWADVLINVTALQQHPVSSLSGALKNWMGAVTRINARDENASFRVYDNQYANVGRINAIPEIRRKCRLIVVDALRPSNGKQRWENAWPFKGLVLGTDPVAVDRVCWDILQQSPLKTNKIDIPIHIQQAANKYNLGVCKMENIQLIII